LQRNVTLARGERSGGLPIAAKCNFGGEDRSGGLLIAAKCDFGDVRYVRRFADCSEM